MAAPSGIKWGNIITGSKDTRKGKIGIYAKASSTNTTTTVTVEVWFASMYSLSDTNNTYYYNEGSTSATTSKGKVNISHTVSTGSGWSTSNQTRLGSYTHTYSRTTSAQTKYFAAKITGIDNFGSSNVSSVYTSITVPAKPSYTVSYNANGGSGAPSAQTKWYGTALTLSTTKPTRTGYSFSKWNTAANGSGTSYNSGASYTSDGSNVTLYAQWTANTYAVTYNANGGTGAPANQTKTYGQTLTLSSTKPTRTNYNFKGWGTSASATTVAYSAGGSYTANAAITLYAIWELAYIKPRITTLSVDRCDSDGTLNDEGMYALVKFNWASDRAISSINIQWKLSTSSSYENDTTVSASGTSGSINEIIGSNSLDTDHSYDLCVTVTDEVDHTTNYAVLPGTKFIIDLLANGNGIAFGKPAEHDGILEVGYQARFTGGINGNLHVTGGTTSFPDLVFKASYQGTDVDFNKYKTSGIFGIYGACPNGPIVAGEIGVLIVSGYTSDWLNQEFIVIDGGNGAVTRYERSFYLGSTWTEWTKTEHKGRVYNEAGMITPIAYGTGNYSMKFGVNNNKELVWLYQSGGSTSGSKWFSPATDASVLLGASSYRWGQIYSTTSSISSSDRNQKKDFTEFDERYEELFTNLKPQLFKFKDGTSDRKHSGFISQDVEEAMIEAGLTDKEFAGFCKDIKQIKMGEDEETGEVFLENVYDENGKPVYTYSLRYEEFIALNTHMIQKQQSKINALTSELSSLKNEIQELKKLLTNSAT